ncbi:hypothetical protein BZG36_03251 [Bifiguratus adelaidae]|uniref:Uncharacterized protein n=1 Tax=Bifiguratus adelaidae TaxID=1938954 RepID=A0A261Y035_9FUNG|nr:hypothetical protein BZG36_03251 [Bifiguratus adelaidae]
MGNTYSDCYDPYNYGYHGYNPYWQPYYNLNNAYGYRYPYRHGSYYYPYQSYAYPYYGGYYPYQRVGTVVYP